jgi:hypothetical protein
MGFKADSTDIYTAEMLENIISVMVGLDSSVGIVTVDRDSSVGIVTVDRDSSVGVANRYGLDGLGIESRWRGQSFHTRPDLPWGLQSLL